ncbi:ABC transporter [Streptomyces sp. NPDC002851]
MTALFAYQAGLLLRSQRWLPPVLLYGTFLAVGTRAGDPVLDAFGWAAAGLLPVTAWLARLCATQEPPAARHCAAAATSPWRVHLAGLLVALGCGLVLGAAGTTVLAALADPKSTDHQVAVPLPPAILAGLLASAVCALLGAAVGALCTRPLLHSTGYSVGAIGLGSLFALVTTGSPAASAVRGLITGSRTGTVHIPVLQLATAALAAGAVAAVACGLSSRRA